MAAITRAAVSSPLLDHRTTITNCPTAAKIPKLINPYINNGVVQPNAPVDIDKPAATTSTTRADETHPDGLRASPALISFGNIPSNKVGLLNVIIDGAIEVTSAERGLVILDSNGSMKIALARNFKQEEIAEAERQISFSILREVRKKGKPVITDNASEDRRFDGSVRNRELSVHIL